MTLENLLAIHTLVAQAPDKVGIARLLSCLAEAGSLLAQTRQWFKTEYPELAD
jgi:hypothetical protein